jgi:hypothetical protein
VENAASVRMREPRRDVARDPLRLVVGEWHTGCEAVVERAGLEALEHHERAPVLGRPVVVEAADVRVAQRGGRAGFALEAGRIGVPAQQLDCDAPLEFGVVRRPDL